MVLVDGTGVVTADDELDASVPFMMVELFWSISLGRLLSSSCLRTRLRGAVVCDESVVVVAVVLPLLDHSKNINILLLKRLLTVNNSLRFYLECERCEIWPWISLICFKEFKLHVERTKMTNLKRKTERIGTK